MRQSHCLRKKKRSILAIRGMMTPSYPVFARKRPLILLPQVRTFTALLDGMYRGIKIMKRWQCVVCGWIYDEAEGAPEEGIAPGTAWDDVPDDFICPDCGVGKEDFEMVEI